MTNWGVFSLIVFSFIVPPIVLIHRSRIPSKKIWKPGIPFIAIGIYLGIFLGPAAFACLIPCYPAQWPPLKSHLFMIPTTLILSSFITLIIFKLKQKSEIAEQHRIQAIEETIKKMKSHGGAKIPKGPYVPHKPWNVGTAAGTPFETRGEEGHGPYGIHMP